MTSSQNLDPQIETLNQRLKAARLGLRVERRGDKLALRGTLPPRPESDRRRPHQQRIPLGIPATKAGLKQAEREAKVIAARLIENTFDWQVYLPLPGKVMASAELGEKVLAFQAQYFAQVRGDDPKVLASATTTWEKAYAPYLRKLQTLCNQRPNLNLPEAILATVKTTRPHSRSRQVCCTALEGLADFLHLPLVEDLKALWGNYGNHQTQLRELPSDALIVEWFERIPNPTWRFVYGVMATYGLRNHEVFFCDYSSLSRRGVRGRYCFDLGMSSSRQ
jgi:hypothetical protein